MKKHIIFWVVLLVTSFFVAKTRTVCPSGGSTSLKTVDLTLSPTIAKEVGEKGFDESDFLDEVISLVDLPSRIHVTKQDMDIHYAMDGELLSITFTYTRFKNSAWILFNDSSVCNESVEEAFVTATNNLTEQVAASDR